MAARVCRVSFTDSSGVTHAIEVAAESLFEAAALGVHELMKSGLAPVIPGPATQITVAVKEPATEHMVTVRQIQNWVSATARSPQEKLRKERLKGIVSQTERRF